MTIKKQARKKNVQSIPHMQQNSRYKLKILALSFVAVAITAAIGTFFVQGWINSEWYRQNRPESMPPDYVFSIVWTFLYILIAFSLFLSWTRSRNSAQRNAVGWLYGSNLVFNAAWPLAFFALQSPLLAIIDLALIWLTIIGAIIVSWQISRLAALLLIPYFLWVSFAAVLNSQSF